MVVSCKLYGGLANNLFQIAACLAYSIKHGLAHYVPFKINNPHYPEQKPVLFKGVCYSDINENLPVYKEPHFHYAEIPYMKGILLDGYFQSFLYVDPYRNEILKAFGMDDLVINEGCVSVHIRRGDYLKYSSIHPLVTLDYIKAAAAKIKGDYCFQVHSDDPQWCKDNLTNEIFDDRAFEIEEQGDELFDLKYMAMAEHIITSNSTFSLWSAYVNPNPNKIVISPIKWFGEALNHSTKDLYIPGSLIL